MKLMAYGTQFISESCRLDPCRVEGKMHQSILNITPKNQNVHYLNLRLKNLTENISKTKAD